VNCYVPLLSMFPPREPMVLNIILIKRKERNSKERKENVPKRK